MLRKEENGERKTSGFPFTFDPCGEAAGLLQNKNFTESAAEQAVKNEEIRKNRADFLVIN